MVTGGVTAKFIGKSSMGFETGNVYTLQLVWRTIKRRIGGSIFGHWETMRCLCAYDTDNHQRWCPYSSYKSFEMNWEIVEFADPGVSFSFVKPTFENVCMEIRVKYGCRLNVRSGPDFKYKVLRIIDAYDGWWPCTAIYTSDPKKSGQSEVWCYISDIMGNGDPVNGWVCMPYVDVRKKE